MVSNNLNNSNCRFDKVDNNNNGSVCCILVIDSQQPRLIKVASILQENSSELSAMNLSTTESSIQINIEYIPCIAKFGSYRDDEGDKIRYLLSVDYYGADGKFEQPQSLLPFFETTENEEEHGNKADAPLFSSIAGAVLGSGIDNDGDVERIASFLQIIANNCRVPIEMVKPNPPYTSMQEEIQVYKGMSDDEKSNVTQLRTMGPGKIAQVAYDFACSIITEVMKQQQQSKIACTNEHDTCLTESTVEDTDIMDEEYQPSSHLSAPKIIDPTKNRFSCRKCRKILFGTDDLQDPPHEPLTHQFSYRKQRHSHGFVFCNNNNSLDINNNDPCQSYFLQTSLDWMKINEYNNEGKFNCPYCDSKIGNFHWSGAQCSCGTWVVPAIQIPKSKVDLVPPIIIASDGLSSGLPPGTIICQDVRINRPPDFILSPSISAATSTATEKA